MSYREACEFIAKHTEIIELVDGDGRVAICPEWQGRVMTSTCDGLEGESFGFINRGFIEWGKPDPHFNNYGAEERIWLSPEGGPFSLWFKPGAKQTLDNWFTSPAINEGAFEVVSQSGDTPGEPTSCMLAREMKLQSTAGTDFDLGVTREVRMLDDDDLEKLFGAAAAELMADEAVKVVAYETVNTITNQGPAMDRKKGLLSIWILSMMNCGPKTVIIVPYKPGPESLLGPAVKGDYFGQVPADRLMVTPEAILFRGDGEFRSKIGTSQRRARNVMGAMDYLGGSLTLANFSMPDDPTKHAYMNNGWEVNMTEPYVGDVANCYNDGSPEPGKKGLGAFYELESLSPAKELATGESLSHRHSTVHVQADAATLARLAQLVLGVDLGKVKDAMKV